MRIQNPLGLQFWMCQTVELISPVAMEDGMKFAIREGGRTVGAGQVTKVIE